MNSFNSCEQQRKQVYSKAKHLLLQGENSKQFLAVLSYTLLGTE
jgi:hypothetical protein